MGQRDRMAEDREASPFALLVEGADAPPPPAKNRGEPAAASRSSDATAKDATTAADAPAAAPASSTDRAAPPKQDDSTANTATVLADATVATASQTPPKIAIPEIATPDSEKDPKTDADSVDVTTTTAGDASTAQTAAQTNPPQPSVTPAAPTAPITPAVVIPVQTVPAASAGHDNDKADDTAAGPIKAAVTPTTVPAGDPQPTDTPGAVPQRAAAPKKEKAATAADTSTEPSSNDDASPVDGKDAQAADGSGKTSAPADPAKSDTAHPAQDHARPRNHTDVQKPDDLFAQTLGAAANGAVHGAKPPSEAMHAVLQAAEGIAGGAGQAVTAPTTSQATLDPAVPIAGLAVEIAARAQAGRNRFEIRLDPPELGRIDVRLDVDNSGQVTSRLVVDRPETLEHLRRDASELQRALQQAGLKTSDNGLQFSLRDQSGGFAGRDNGHAPTAPARLIVPDASAAPIDALQARYGRTVRVGGIDISV